MIPFETPLPSFLDFHRLFHPVGVSQAQTSSVYAQLKTAYSGEGRFYHTLTHLGQVLGVVHFLESSDNYPIDDDSHLALQVATWFHDAVYDPRRDDNEQQSAAWMVKELTPLNISSNILQQASNFIMATRSHQVAIDDPSAQILLDADLSILGAPPDKYAQYKAQIRQEYAHVSEEAYRVGRTAILKQFLARPRIFYGEILHSALEAQARQNLTDEIQFLDK